MLELLSEFMVLECMLKKYLAILLFCPAIGLAADLKKLEFEGCSVYVPEYFKKVNDAGNFKEEYLVFNINRIAAIQLMDIQTAILHTEQYSIEEQYVKSGVEVTEYSQYIAVRDVTLTYWLLRYKDQAVLIYGLTNEEMEIVLGRCI